MRYPHVMFIEEFIEKWFWTTAQGSLTADEADMMHSFAEQIVGQKGLTTRQGWRAGIILQKVLNDPTLYHRLKIDPAKLSQALKEPKWRTPLRQSVQRTREARHIGDNILAIMMAAHREIREQLTRLGSRTVTQDDQWYYLVPISTSNIDAVLQFLGQHEIDIDPTTEEYLNGCLEQNHKTIIQMVGNGAVANVQSCELLNRYLLQHCGATIL